MEDDRFLGARVLKIKPFENQHASQVALVFHIAVRGVDTGCYTIEQLSAWSGAPRSSRHWLNRLNRSQAWVAIDDDLPQTQNCIGFINVETCFHERGYIDSLYVHPAYQHQGVAWRLYKTLESWAITEGYVELTTDASILSRPLFIKHGFQQVHKTYQQKRGQILKGFLMQKPLL